MEEIKNNNINDNDEFKHICGAEDVLDTYVFLFNKKLNDCIDKMKDNGVFHVGTRKTELDEIEMKNFIITIYKLTKYILKKYYNYSDDENI